ncbi:MAG: tetratricopeptide repeat protein [Bacteroidales bacterium]|nr:tetratricopeptide repeat protein [Bacteroidales bacterium]MCF8338702.1 tetratricopeptide repeat protein [Bacteroidales bacterium]
MIKIVILNIILFFSSLMSFSQYRLPDSLANKIKSDAPQSEKISQLKEYASELIYADVSQGRFFIDSAMRMASRHNEEKLLNELYNNKGTYHLYAREYDSAMKAYKKYLSYAIENDLPEVEQTAYSNIGVVFFRKRLSDSAIHYATKSLKLAKKLGDSASLAKAYSDVGGYYLEKDNYVKALENLSKSEKYEDPNNHFEMAVLNIRQGIAYGEIKDFKKARETYMTALRHSKKQNRQEIEGTIYNNIG